jgi:hypothetical protein
MTQFDKVPISSFTAHIFKNSGNKNDFTKLKNLQNQIKISKIDIFITIFL